MKKKTLNEDKGVSSDVQWFVDEIVNKILELDDKVAYQKIPYSYREDGKFIYDDSVKLKTILIKNYFTIKEIDVTIYDFTSEEDYFKSKYRFNFNSEFDIKNNSIRIVVPSISGEIKIGFLKSSLSHELRHMFKNLYAQFNISKIYYSALNIINNPNISNENINKKIAILLYFFSDDEIYSNCQSIYNYGVELIKQLKKKGQYNTINEQFLIDYIEEYNKYYNYKILFLSLVNDNTSFDDYKPNLFNNQTIEKIKKYLTRQIKYCETKFGKVIQKLKDEEKKINESFEYVPLDSEELRIKPLKNIIV